MINYHPRIVDSLLQRKLQIIGAVLIEGPKLCGKSTTATMQAKSVLFVEPDRTLQIPALNPKLLLEGEEVKCPPCRRLRNERRICGIQDSARGTQTTFASEDPGRYSICGA